MSRDSRTVKSSVATGPAPLAVGVAEAARLCGIGRNLFFRLLASGDGPRTIRLGSKRKIIRVEELSRWLASREEANA